MAQQSSAVQRGSGKFAVVTGASSGIGYHLARVFAQNGYDLLINAEDSGISSAAADLQQLGVSVQAVRADLRNRDEVARLWSEIEAIGREVDIAAINAGVGVGGQFVGETDLTEELDMVDLNCRSTVQLAKYVSRHMTRNGSGRILFTSSIAGTMPTPLEAVYGATKAFVLMFSKSLRFELKDTGVSVTALQPGPTDTNFFTRAGMDNTEVGQKGKHDNQPDEVARQAYKALMDGDEHIFAGDLKLKVQGEMGGLIPDTAKAKMHENMAKPKSA